MIYLYTEYYITRDILLVIMLRHVCIQLLPSENTIGAFDVQSHDGHLPTSWVDQDGRMAK